MPNPQVNNDDDEWEKVPSTATATATADDDWEKVEAPKPTPPKVPANKQNLPGAGPTMLEKVNKGIVPMTPPTQFEKERPQLPENGGFGVSVLGTPDWSTIKNVGRGVWHGLGNVASFGKELGKDISDPNKPLFFGGAEEGPQESTLHKYVIAPSEAESKKAQSGEISPIESIGHSAAAAIPFVGPWVAGHAEKAGKTGNFAEEAGEAGGEMLGGKLGEKAVGAAAHPLDTAQTLKDIATGTPRTEAGRLEAAKQQALTVKKPSMSETEYQQKVTNALPDLQKIAQDNKGKIKTPRQAVTGINNRIAEMEAPISDHLQAHPEEVVHPDEYLADLHGAMDGALKNSNVKLTPKEMDAAKTKVMELVGDQQQSMNEIEKTRRRLNTEAEDYFSSRPADKRVMDASDATAIAQKAAGNYLRSRLYGDDAKPGWLERAGVTAVDQAGNPVSIRDLRRKVGNLIDVRDHFEDAMTRAEATGDWKPFDKMFSGPSMAAGAIPAALGTVAGGPLGGLLGLLGGEGLKAWGDYLRSKNPNLNTQKMFSNLERTSPPNTVSPQVRAPLHQYQFPIGPQTSDFAEPIGPATPPGNFQMENLAPNRSGLWQQQVGGMPPIETGAPSPGRSVEPIGPQPARETPLGPITGEQVPMNLPEPQHELFNLPQTPRVGEAPPTEGGPGEIGGKGREGTLQPIQTTPAEKLTVGDTFVDDKGDPRRITDIQEDGTIKTADHTLRDYEEGEIKHLGEINSPQAQIARGGMFHPAEEAEDRFDLGEINAGEKPGPVAVNKMVKPGEKAPPEAIAPEKAIETLKERVKDRAHEGEERDYQMLPAGDLNPRQLYQTTFLLDDGSALQGDMGIMSHMQLAREVGQNHLNDANAIRVVTPDSFELHNMPSDAQLSEMNRYWKNLDRGDRQNVHDPTYVYWDFYPKDVKGYSADAVSEKHESGAGSFSDFRRAIDKYYSPTTTAEVSPDGSSVKLMENPLNIKGTGERGRVSTSDLLKAFNKYTKQTLGKLTLEKAEPEEMVERAKSLAEDEAKYQLAQDNSGAAWYTKQMDEHDAVAQQMRPDLRDPAKLSMFKMAEAVLSAGQKPYGNFKAAIKAWDGYVDTGKFPERNPETGKSWGPRSAAAYGNALGMLNNLITEYGEKGASDWLMSEHPVSELRKYNDNVSGKMDSQRPGVLILGEKRGPFAQNLHKIESAFTADMWVARTWNRWMGTAEMDPKTGEIASDAPRNDSERALMRETFDATAKKLNLSTSALQAVMWYYEQALHNAHGVPKESWSFSDAAKRASDEEAGIATTTKSGKAVKPKAAATLSPVRGSS